MMNKSLKNKLWVPALLALLVSGCASLNSVSMTQVPSNRNKPIQASSSSWGFLGIFFTNSFVDDAVDDLRRQCPTGKISGVYTKHENRFYLLMLKRMVTATAYCEAGQKGAI